MHIANSLYKWNKIKLENQRNTQYIDYALHIIYVPRIKAFIFNNKSR